MEAGGHSKRKMTSHVADVIVVHKQKSLSLTQLSQNGKLVAILRIKTMNTKTTVEGGNDLIQEVENQTMIRRRQRLEKEAENPKIERKWSPKK